MDMAALVSVKITIKKKTYVIQGKASASLYVVIKPMLYKVYKRYIGDKMIICDANGHQVNKSALLKFFIKRPLHLIIHRGRKWTYIARLTGQIGLTGGHTHFYLTYSRGVKRLFVNRWAPHCRYLRIEGTIGETLQSAVQRDGRVQRWDNNQIEFLSEDTDTGSLVYSEDYIISPTTKNRSFILSKCR
jgi:hypothetical protein